MIKYLGAVPLIWEMPDRGDTDEIGLTCRLHQENQKLFCVINDYLSQDHYRTLLDDTNRNLINIISR
jgi:hypothetical protein